MFARLKRQRAQARRGRRLGRQLHYDVLEARQLLCGDNCLEIELLDDFDQFGAQIAAIMGYLAPGESLEQARIVFSIYDTGASVVTVSAADQTLLELSSSSIQVKTPGGAVADAIGGAIVGDVSVPGEIIASGMSAVTFSGDFLEMSIDFGPGTVSTPGVQVFLGTEDGSPILPTITGTVIHNPTPTNPDGVAAWIDMTAYQFDFGQLFPEFPEFQGIIVQMPDIEFVQPGTKITVPDDGTVSGPVRIPLELFGENNYADPGDEITATQNPVQTNVTIGQDEFSESGLTMLFDTGAQLSVISTEMAISLGLDLGSPSNVINVQGAAGTVDVPGFTIDYLDIPRDDDGDGVTDGVLRFSNVPIYVLDVVDGLDGILGMNLFNLAHGMLYDPFDPAGPSLQVSFFNDVVRELPDLGEEFAIDLLTSAMPALTGSFGGQTIPSFGLELPPPPTNDAPINIQLSRGDVFDDLPGAWIGKVTTVDPDAGDTHTYSVNDPRFEVRGGDLFLKAGASIDLATEPTIAIDITATDSGTPGLSLTRSFTLQAVSRPESWEFGHQWRPLAVDVNADGDVTPLDSLLVINHLNEVGPGPLEPVAGGTAPGHFWDVSGDDAVSPLDALLIINWLNSAGSNGEPASLAQSNPAASLDDSSADDAPAMTGESGIEDASLDPAIWSAVWRELERDNEKKK